MTARLYGTLAEWLTRCPAKAVPSGACVRITQVSILLPSIWTSYLTLTFLLPIVLYKNFDCTLSEEAPLGKSRFIIKPLKTRYERQRHADLLLTVKETEVAAPTARL
nr:hypothetical protein CFP56_00388 [Quercus suber]